MKWNLPWTDCEAALQDLRNAVATALKAPTAPLLDPCWLSGEWRERELRSELGVSRNSPEIFPMNNGEPSRLELRIEFPNHLVVAGISHLCWIHSGFYKAPQLSRTLFCAQRSVRFTGRSRNPLPWRGVGGWDSLKLRASCAAGQALKPYACYAMLHS